MATLFYRHCPYHVNTAVEPNWHLEDLELSIPHFACITASDPSQILTQEVFASVILVWKIWNNHYSKTSSQNSKNTAHDFHSSELPCSHPKAVARPAVFEVDNLLQLCF